MESKCNICRVHRCEEGMREKLPKFCPMIDESLYKKADSLLEAYSEFFIASTEVESEGYCYWPRVREIIEVIKKMSYKKIGLAFCAGFINEASILTEIFEEHGIEIVGAMCKTGGSDKVDAGVDEESKVNPYEFEARCNPIAQALILNKEKTDFNIIMGLCVGHDSLFMKYSDALVTTLIVKDRATGHNPAVALYLKDGYFSSRLID